MPFHQWSADKDAPVPELAPGTVPAVRPFDPRRDLGIPEFVLDDFSRTAAYRRERDAQSRAKRSLSSADVDARSPKRARLPPAPLEEGDEEEESHPSRALPEEN